MAGLLAARVLSDHFARVVLVERDHFPPPGEPRKGVPQGRHLHGLLAGGLRALQEMFPELLSRALARGGIAVDVGDFGPWYIGNVQSLPIKSGLQGLLMSRPLFETHVREQVLGYGNIEPMAGWSAVSLLGDARAVRGVRVSQREATGVSERELHADLVVDATGLGSRTPRWLREVGLEAPAEEDVKADIVYTSCYIRRRPHHLSGRECYIISPAPPSLRSGAALAVEGDRYIITLTSYLGDVAPATYADMIEYARSLIGPGLYELLLDAEPLSEPVHYRDPISRRRRYERLKSFPAGLLVIGDALCHFNPAYGQGMSVAALEAQALAASLSAVDPRPLWRRFFRAAAPIVDIPWAIVTGGDFAFPGVVGQRPPGTAIANAYFARLNRAAAVDPRVVEARLKVMHLTAPLSSLFSPAVMARVFLHAGKSRPLVAPAIAPAPAAAE